MNKKIKLEEGKVYHIYNRGNNHENLFTKELHYLKFLSLYERYIEPIAYTYAWVLMPNHFHFLIKTKKNICYKYSKTKNELSPEDYNLFKWETAIINEENKDHQSPNFSKHFSHLFNSYSRYFNLDTERTGVLFEREFERKEIINKNHFKNTLIYIHQNPINHGFCTHLLDYPWSSYLIFINNLPTKLKRDIVLKIFDGKDNFIEENKKPLDFSEMEKYLFEQV